MKTFYKEFSVINILKCNAFEHWNKIGIGSRVIFEAYGTDDENVSKDVDVDKELIRVILTHNEKNEELAEKPTIGMLIEEESKYMKDIIKNGWTKIFKGTICKFNKDAQYDQRISVAVHIHPKNE